MQGRLERCQLRCSIAQRITEFCIFQVKRQILSICLPLFWLGSGPSSFHKVYENSTSCHKEVELENYNLSKRHGRVQGRVIDTKRYSHFSLPELGRPHQLQEVCVRHMSYVGISGIGNRFSEYEGGTSQGESRKDQKTMTVSTLSDGLGKVNGKTLVYNNGSSASSLHEGVIPGYNCVTQGAKNRTGLAGAESGFEQRMVHTVHCPTAFAYIRKMGGESYNDSKNLTKCAKNCGNF